MPDPQIRSAQLRDDAVMDRCRYAAVDRAHPINEEAVGARRVWIA
jgi:hypothetical protein